MKRREVSLFLGYVQLSRMLQIYVYDIRIELKSEPHVILAYARHTKELYA